MYDSGTLAELASVRVKPDKLRRCRRCKELFVSRTGREMHCPYGPCADARWDEEQRKYHHRRAKQMVARRRQQAKGAGK